MSNKGSVETIIIYSDNTRQPGETFSSYTDALKYVTQKKLEYKPNRNIANESNILPVSAIVDIEEQIDKVRFQD